MERCSEMDRNIRKEEKKNGKKQIRNTVLRGGQKGLWDAVKQAQNKPRTQTPKEMTWGNVNFNRDEDLAQGFAEFFNKKVEDIVSSTEINLAVFNGSNKVTANCENFFTAESVLKAMLDMKSKSSYGFDNIPVRILKDGSAILVKPYH